MGAGLCVPFPLFRALQRSSCDWDPTSLPGDKDMDVDDVDDVFIRFGDTGSLTATTSAAAAEEATEAAAPASAGHP